MVAGTGWTNNVIEGNYVGVAADGVTSLGNQDGVVIDRSNSNTIGGVIGRRAERHRREQRQRGRGRRRVIVLPCD